MSADNFLGIYRTNEGEYVGRNCWSECPADQCKRCTGEVVFTTRGLPEAIGRANILTGRGDYEYSYRFLNFPGVDIAPDAGRLDKFWICYVAGTDGGCHYRHTSLASAQREAERLVRLSTVWGETDGVQKDVYLLECVGICKVEPSPVKWEIPRPTGKHIPHDRA